MTVATLSSFFGWLSLLHIGMFTLTFLLILTFRETATRMHARLFDLPPERVKQVFYSWLGLYKLLIFVTAIGPWLALQLI